jgi:hypothetical protein
MPGLRAVTSENRRESVDKKKELNSCHKFFVLCGGIKEEKQLEANALFYAY